MGETPKGHIGARGGLLGRNRRGPLRAGERAVRVGPATVGGCRPEASC